MKKIGISFALILMMIIMSGQTAYAQEDSSPRAGITTVNEYNLTLTNGTVCVLGIFRNDNDYECNVSWTVKTYDSEGNIVETYDSVAQIVAPNQEFALTSHFYNSSAATAYDYLLSVDNQMWLGHSVYDSVDVDQQQSSDGAVVLTATNKGSETVQSCVATVLFFDSNDNILAFKDLYLTNANNYKLQPREIVKREATCSSIYAKYSIYYTAYAW